MTDASYGSQEAREGLSCPPGAWMAWHKDLCCSWTLIGQWTGSWVIRELAWGEAKPYGPARVQNCNLASLSYMCVSPMCGTPQVWLCTSTLYLHNIILWSMSHLRWVILLCWLMCCYVLTTCLWLVNAPCFQGQRKCTMAMFSNYCNVPSQLSAASLHNTTEPFYTSRRLLS